MTQVALLELPVTLWARAQEQTDELLREMTLIAEGLRGEASGVDAGQSAEHLPVRLIDLVAELTADFGGVSTAQEQQLASAAAAGRQVIPALLFDVPPEAAAASRVLGDLLDEADEYCRLGRHLLTLAADEEIVRFRHWYLVQFIDQIAGAEPTAWPQYDGAWPS
ncbi:MAG: hypothetical protein QOD70_2325 [Frankiales bacterium]|nr:hypothetical protein [Frankiales bacterium]